MKKTDWVDEVLSQLDIPLPQEPVSICCIIPTFNSEERIEATLLSVERQQYPNLEVIIVDAGSTDHTLSIVRGYSHLISRIYVTSSYNIAQMLNRGISLSSSRYITFIYPGSIYLSSQAMFIFASVAEEHTFPELVYSGLVQRELLKDPEVINDTIDRASIGKGIFPSSIPACLFRADVFDTVGNFENYLFHRLGFDLICRLIQLPKVRTAHIDRVLLDVDLGLFSYGRALRFSWETWQILRKRFGIRRAFLWTYHLDKRMIFKAYLQRLRQHLLRR